MRALRTVDSYLSSSFPLTAIVSPCLSSSPRVWSEKPERAFLTGSSLSGNGSQALGRLKRENRGPSFHFISSARACTS
jgi:hypothetical protein